MTVPVPSQRRVGGQSGLPCICNHTQSVQNEGLNRTQLLDVLACSKESLCDKSTKNCGQFFPLCVSFMYCVSKMNKLCVFPLCVF